MKKEFFAVYDKDIEGGVWMTYPTLEEALESYPSGTKIYRAKLDLLGKSKTMLIEKVGGSKWQEARH